jgi:hypothetical protein
MWGLLLARYVICMYFDYLNILLLILFDNRFSYVLQ